MPTATRRTALSSARWTLAGALALQLYSPATISAQQSRPYRGLFGGAETSTSAGRLLELSASVAEGYDANVQAELPVGTLSPEQVSGFYTALATDVKYTARGQRSQFAINLASNYRYFASENEAVALGHSLGVGVMLPIGERSDLLVNQAVSYMPAYLYGLFARSAPPAVGEIVPPAGNYAVTNQSSRTYVTDGRFTRRLGRRSTLSFLSAYRRTQFGGGDTAVTDLTSFDVGGDYLHPLSRDLALRLGYVYRSSKYSNGLEPVEHDLNLGFDYDRPISRTRRTKVGFSFGSSVLEGPAPGQLNDQTVRHFNAVADVRLSHQIGRTWMTRAAYRRGAQYVEELAAPVYTDGVTVTANGFLNRRTDISGGAAYSTGAVIGQQDSAFVTSTANVRLRFGLNRSLALFGEYLYYRYDFADLQLQSGAPSQLNRNGVQLGITLWLPVAKR